jgi:hypothetical protein
VLKTETKEHHLCQNSTHVRIRAIAPRPRNGKETAFSGPPWSQLSPSLQLNPPPKPKNPPLPQNNRQENRQDKIDLSFLLDPKAAAVLRSPAAAFFILLYFLSSVYLCNPVPPAPACRGACRGSVVRDFGVAFPITRPVPPAPACRGACRRSPDLYFGFSVPQCLRGRFCLN